MPVSAFLEKSQLAGGLHSSVTWRALQGETIIAAEQAAGDRIFESSAAPMRDSEGRIIGSVTISRDITARKRDGAALRTAYSELATIYANTPVLLLVVDDELRVEKVNDLAANSRRMLPELFEGSLP